MRKASQPKPQVQVLHANKEWRDSHWDQRALEIQGKMPEVIQPRLMRNKSLMDTWHKTCSIPLIKEIEI